MMIVLSEGHTPSPLPEKNVLVGTTTKSTAQQTCAKILERSGIQDPQDPSSGILAILDARLTFCRKIQWILDLAREVFAADLGSSLGKLMHDPGDPGSFLEKVTGSDGSSIIQETLLIDDVNFWGFL